MVVCAPSRQAHRSNEVGLFIVLAFLYPLLVHIAVLTGSAELTAASLGWLAALALAPGLMRGRPVAWAAALALGALIFALARGAWLWLPVYLPSIAADAFVAFLFARTLAPGETPLIEQIVRLMHAPEERLDARVAPYARRLTLAWAVLFATLGLVSLALALFAAPHGILLLFGVRPPFTVPQQAWSVFANFIEYALVAAFFVGEYVLRRRRFPQQPYRGVLDFLRRMLAVAPRARGLPRPPGVLAGRAARADGH